VSSELPAEVQIFITRHIVSVEELEVLLLLHGQKDGDWSAAEINARLRSQEVSIAKWLEALVASRLVSANGGRYRFTPATPELEQQAAALVDAYQTHRIKVIEFIFSKPSETLLSFVRAFEIRKRS
jgi:predicted transcriptional regulator